MKPIVSIWLVVFASCKSEPTTPIANVGGVAVSAVPAGWVAIDPDDERKRCANYASDEWQVAIEAGVVTFTESKNHEPDTGPALPFTPPQHGPERSRYKETWFVRESCVRATVRKLDCVCGG